MIDRRHPLSALALLIASPALAEPAPATTLGVAVPQVPQTRDAPGRESWIAECGHRLDAVNRGRDGAEPFRAACTAWLDYYQRAGLTAKQIYAGLTIPVAMVPLQGAAVPCKTVVVERKVYVAARRHAARQVRDKRIRID